MTHYEVKQNNARYACVLPLQDQHIPTLRLHPRGSFLEEGGMQNAHSKDRGRGEELPVFQIHWEGQSLIVDLPQQGWIHTLCACKLGINL